MWQVKRCSLLHTSLVKAKAKPEGEKLELNCLTYYSVPYNMVQGLLFSKIRSIYTTQNHRMLLQFFFEHPGYYQHLHNAREDFGYISI